MLWPKYDGHVSGVVGGCLSFSNVEEIAIVHVPPFSLHSTLPERNSGQRRSKDYCKGPINSVYDNIAISFVAGTTFNIVSLLPVMYTSASTVRPREAHHRRGTGKPRGCKSLYSAAAQHTSFSKLFVPLVLRSYSLLSSQHTHQSSPRPAPARLGGGSRAEADGAHFPTLLAHLIKLDQDEVKRSCRHLPMSVNGEIGVVAPEDGPRLHTSVATCIFI